MRDEQADCSGRGSRVPASKHANVGMYAFPALSMAEAAQQQASGTAQGGANGDAR